MKIVRETPRIRAARADEATLLSELALRSKAYWGYSPEFMEACRDELSFTAEQLASDHMRFFVIENARSIVGFYALVREAGDAMELLALFVEPAFIGKGFGRLLIEHAKSVASTMGARHLTIQGDPNAERFYIAAGGVLTGTTESGSIPGRFLPTFSVSLDEPAWKNHLRLYEAKIRELQEKGPPIKAAIRRFVTEKAGADLGEELWIGFSVDMTHVGFDIWYQTDEELERDKSSGRQEQLAEIMRSAARECAHAGSEVRFHSHQFVREKCGGDYFLYMR